MKCYLLLLFALSAANAAHALWRNTPAPRLHSIFDDGDSLQRRHWFTPHRELERPLGIRDTTRLRITDPVILHRRGRRMTGWGVASIAAGVPLLAIGVSRDNFHPRTSSPGGSAHYESYDGGKYYYMASTALTAIGVFLIARGQRLVKKYPRRSRDAAYVE